MPAPTPDPRRVARLPFWLALGSAALLLLSGLAFWPRYLSKSRAEVDGYTHFHAALGVLWLVTAAAQSLLVRGQRLSAHRRVGRATWVLAPVFAVSTILLAHYRFRRMSPETFAAEAYWLYLPLFTAVLFATAYGLGAAWRRVPAVHGRFMAATAVLLVDPVVARILYFYLPPLPSDPLYQAVTFSILSAILLLMFRSLPQGAPGRRAFAGFVAFAVAAQLLWFVLPQTKAWLAFATWFRSIPLT
jgi:hypothetical protein